MNKIIILNGSNRRNGNTAKILKEVIKILEMDPTIEIVYFDISRMNFGFCRGCTNCYQKGFCPLNDDAEIFSKQIETASGLIIGSPTYESAITGQLKALIDRSHLVMEQALHNKYTFALTTYENSGGVAAANDLNRIFMTSAGIRVGKLAIKITDNAEKTQKQLKMVQKMAKKFQQKVVDKAPKPLLDQLISKAIFEIGMKPLADKNRQAYQGLIDKWYYYGILKE